MKLKTFILTFLMMMSCSILFGQGTTTGNASNENWLKAQLADSDYGTIILANDIELTTGNIVIPNGRTVTIDLNGHKLSTTDNSTYIINNLGKLTIKDSNESGKGKISAYGGIYNGKTYNPNARTEFGDVNLNAKLTIESGVIEDISSDERAVIYNYGMLYITGGKFYGKYSGITNYGMADIKNTYIECLGADNDVAAIVNDFDITFGENVYIAGEYRAVTGTAAYTGTPIFLYAELNGKKYSSLQDAIDNAIDGDVVTLIANGTEDEVLITQKADVDVTINGNNKTFTGHMTIFGSGRHTGAETLTIKNVVFQAVDGKGECIASATMINGVNSYAHNVTVEGCTFKGNDTYSANKTFAIRFPSGGVGYDLTVTDCTADNKMFGLLWVTQVVGKLIVDNCTAEGVKEGIVLTNTTTATITNTRIEASIVAIRAGQTGAADGTINEFTFNNNILKSNDIAIQIRGNATDSNLSMTKNVVSGTTHISGNTADTNIDADANYWGEGLTGPVVAEGSAPIVVNSYYLDAAREQLIVTALTLQQFVEKVTEVNGTYNGTFTEGGVEKNITVKVVPVSGDARTTDDVRVPNRLQKYTNPEVYYAQYQRFSGLTDVNISNVNFVFYPAAVTVTDAWNTAGATTTADNINGELQLLNTGSVSFANCSFEKMSVSPINAATLSVTSSTFNGLDAYAIKDIKATTATITGTTFTDCNGGFWFNNAPTTLTVTDNTFTGTGRRGAIQFSANGDYANTEMTVTGNEVTDDAAFLWQLNNTISNAQLNAILDKNNNTYTTAFVAGSVELHLQGEGTADNPYIINDISDLEFFRDDVNAGNDYAGKYIQLNADIDLADENWVGIGSINADHGFMGNFDGKTYKIKNLTITNPALDSDGYAYAGLFGVTEGIDKDNQNTIKNLTIENVTINTTGHIAAAAIAYPYYTIVENVTVCGKIAITGGDYTSGALAYTRRCVNASNIIVSGSEDSYITGANVVGGVISDIQTNGGLIANYSGFNVSGVKITGTNMVGGISGIISSQTLNGCSVKNVTLSCQDNNRIGIVSGSLGGVSTVSNVDYENVTGATAIIGATYDGGKAVEAKIGDTYYATLQAAIDAVQNGETITLLSDITENVTLTEKVGLYYTINGSDKTMNGSITVNPLSDTNNNRRITISNINFVENTDTDVDFISAVKTNHYPRLTISGCDFTGSGNDGDVAIRLKSSHSVVIENCTGTGLHSFLQNTSGWNLTVNNVTVTESKGGLALGTVQGVTVAECEVTTDTYGIRLDANTYNNNAVIETCTVNAFIPVVVRNVNTESSITFNGTNTMTQTNTDGLWCAIGTTEYEENGTMPTAPTGNVSVTLNDTGLNREGIYGSALNGEGTVDNPYLIETVNDLVFFRDQVNGGNNYAGKHVKLAANIDLNNEEWTPIGNVTYNSQYKPVDASKVFSGVFDGNNKVIYNLTINKTVGGADTQANVGFFGMTGEGAVIKNLTLTDVNINTDGRNVGALIGYTYMATIDNITVNGDIQINGGNNVSGVAGMTRYYVMSATNIKVVGNDGSAIVGNNIVGGIFAEIAPNGSEQKFENLSVENVAITGVGGVGGIVGLLTTGAVDSVSVKNVVLTGRTDYQGDAMGRIRLGSVSGLMGGKYATIANVTTENVTAKNLDGNAVVLPIIGANYDASSNATEAKIGDTYYATLQTAIDKANNGETIELLANVNNNVTFTAVSAKELTLDLNGYTITSEDNSTITVSNGNHVIIEDSSEPSTGMIKSTAENCEAIAVKDNGNVTFVSGTAYHPVNGVYLYTAGDNNKFTMTGGTIKVDDNGMVLTVASGEATVKDGNLLIENMNQGGISALAYYGTINIEGGNISNIAKVETSYEGKVSITGGTFTFANNETFVKGTIAPFHYAVENENGTFTVIKNDVVLEGTGVENDPYLISNVNELMWFRDYVNLNGTEVHAALTNNIDMSDLRWVSIGTSDKKFTGTFDGRNNTLSNLNADDNECGLFRYTENATVKNLTIENVTVIEPSQDHDGTGAVIGVGSGTTRVENITVKGKIAVAGKRAGAIVGYVYSGLYAENCHVIGSGIDESYVNAFYWASGGIIGFSAPVDGHSEIKNCSVKDIKIWAEHHYGAGAIAGTFKGLLEDVTAENVNVIGKYSEDGRFNGLLCGYQKATGNSYAINSTLTEGNTVIENPRDIVAKIGDNKMFCTLEAAATVSQNGETIQLIWAEGNDPIAMAATFVGDKTVTITGTANVDWSKGFFFVGRNGEGNGHVIFDNAKLTSVSYEDNTAHGFNVSGSKVDDNTTNNGKVEIKNSTIVLDYMLNKNVITLDNSTLTVKNGFSVTGRIASESATGEDATATMTLSNNSKVVVNNMNGMGIGHEAYGIMNIDATSTFETTQNFNISANGTMNVNGGNVKVVGKLTNKGTVNVTGNASMNVTTTADSNPINFNNVTIANANIGGEIIGGQVKGGAVNAFGTNNFTGETNIEGTLSVGYNGSPAEQVVVNITGNFNGGNVLIGSSNEHVLNVGNAEGTETTAHFGQLGAFGDVNIVNADVTYGYTFIRNHFNVTNSTMEIKGGANTYFAGNAKVVLDNTTWNLPGYANIGSYGEYMYGNADVTLKNGSVMNGTNLGIEVDGEKVVKLTLEDSSTLTATNLSNQGSIVLANVEAKVTSNELTGTNNVPTTTVADHKVVYESGVYKVVEKVYVAQVDNGDKFETLQEAVDAVEDGGTITLIANETFTENNRYNNGGWWDGLGYSGDKSFTIDLANFIISQNGALNDYLMWFKNDGAKDNTITLKNGTLNAGTTAYCALATSSSNTNKITINTENIKFIGNNSNGAVLKIRGGAELNVKAGTEITGTDSYVGIEAAGSNTVVNIYEGAEIYQNGKSSNWGCLAGASGNSTINVYGGEGTSAKGGFIAMTSGGTINIFGGEWTANTDGTIANDNNGVLIAQSDKQYNAGAGNSIVNVTGGTFKGGYNCYGNAVGDAQINISGGIFSVNPSVYCAENYGAFPYDETSWVVREIKGEQTIALQAGWNWMSSYISEFDKVDEEGKSVGLSMLVNALGDNGIQIKNNLGSLTNGGATYGWYGTLNAVSVKEMYKVNVVAAQEIDYQGSYVNYDECVIPLYKGWNYIGYPVNERMSLADALAELDANVGDVIKAQNGTAVYTEEEGWFSFDLTELVPGEGYMYQNTSNSIKQLTYTTKKTTSTDSDNRSSKYWTVDATQYPSNMTMIAMTDVEGGDYEVAAFVNGELRGSSRPIYVESLNAHILVLTISGDEVAEVTFKYYDIATGEEVAFKNRINYSNDAVVGSMAEPYMLTRGTTGIGEAEMSQVNIYPNPTTTGTEINLQATCDKVEVFNALGVKVAEYQNVDTIDALETAGIYVIRITNNGNVQNCRLVVK